MLSSEHSRGSRTLTLPALLLLVTFFATGCGFMQSKQAAESVISEHFHKIRTNGYDAVLDDYADKFFTATPRDQWSASLLRVSEKLGAFRSHQVVGWNVSKADGHTPQNHPVHRGAGGRSQLCDYQNWSENISLGGFVAS